MKILRWTAALTMLFSASIAFAADGLIAVKSTRDVDATVTRIEGLLKTRGQTVFARIDHAAGAAKIGKILRPTQVIVFGNPVGGTPLMECAQTMGIDLPQKMLVWEDEKGQVWAGYNDPAYLLQRHGVNNCAATDNVRKALAGLLEAALTP